MDSLSLNEVKDRLLRISNCNKLDVFFPSCVFNNLDLYIETFFKKLNNKQSKKPTILWNLKPWDNFNLLHAIYYQKIRELVRLGFKCVIIIYDKIVENDPNFSDYEKKSLQVSIDKNIRWFTNSGISQEQSEFLTETDLWSFIKFEDFANKFIKLSKLCGFDQDWIKKESAVSFILENLWVIAYEDIINCDITITGASDKNKIWGMLRRDALQHKIVKEYHPPLVLFYPDLFGIDGKLLSHSDTENSISTRDNEITIRKKIMNAPDEFLKTLFDYLIIPEKNGIIYDDKVNSFDQLKRNYKVNELRIFASNFLINYFSSLSL